MSRIGTFETMGWLLQNQALRVLLIAAPGVTGAVAMITSRESILAYAVVLNLAVGILISSALFIAVSILAKRMADERSGLVRATEQQRNNSNTRLSIYDESGLFTDWYFRLRVQEEIERSQRYALEFSLLVTRQIEPKSETDSAAASAEFGEKVHAILRKSDLVAILRDGSYGVLLPIKGLRGAKAVQRRLAKEFDSMLVGVASYPEHGQTSATLLAVATHGAFPPSEAPEEKAPEPEAQAA